MSKTIRALALSAAMTVISLATMSGQSEQPVHDQQGGEVVTPIRVSNSVQSAYVIHRVPPVYPPLARMAHVEGTVQLRVIIAADGTVKKVTVISGDPLLVQSAIQAVRQWRYQPALLNGHPVEVVTQVEVNFALAEAGPPEPDHTPPAPPGFVMPTPAQQAAELKAEKDALAAVDPQTAADVRQLMDVIGMKKNVTQIMMTMMPQFANLALARVPLAKRQEAVAFLTQMVVQRFRTDEGLYDLFIPIYAQHFSDQEIRTALAFYRSPVGQKFVSQQTLMMSEVQAPFMAHWNLIVMPAIMTEFSRELPSLQGTPITNPGK